MKGETENQKHGGKGREAPLVGKGVVEVRTIEYAYIYQSYTEYTKIT